MDNVGKKRLRVEIPDSANSDDAQDSEIEEIACSANSYKFYSSNMHVKTMMMYVQAARNEPSR